jgi:DUF1365 family protein
MVTPAGPQPPSSGLYVGAVRHRRLKPKAHAFTYPLFMALLDVDQLDALMEISPFLSRNRFNWASFDDRDHLGDPARPLRDRYRESAEAAGFRFPEGRVLLLTHLRYWGYCFNPVCFLYAYDPDGRLALLGAEVMNTPWKERVLYWMDPASPRARAGQGAWSFDTPKTMHVSPFMPMALRYRWAFTAPGEDLAVHMALSEGEDLVFDADLDLARREWDAPSLHRTLLRYPWMTLKVIAAIHWEALWLWIKRVPVYTHPKKLRTRP